MSNKILLPDDPNISHCTICGKEFEKDLLILKDQDLCSECRKTFANMAYIYCNTCKTIVTRVTPGMSGCGYLVVPGAILHVNACPKCRPGIVKSIPIEFENYEKGR